MNCIKSLKIPSGDMLVNVPIDEHALMRLGFSEAQSKELCDQARIDIAWEDVRNKRNALLTVCDYTQIPDSPLTSEHVTAWAGYRQQLRDITNTYAGTGPESVIWPTKPA